MPNRKPAPHKRKPREKTERPGARELFRRFLDALPAWRRLLYSFLLYAFVCVVLLWHGASSVRVHEGDIAESDIVSPRNLTYVDRDATEGLRREAADTAGVVYIILPTFQEDTDAVFRALLDPRSLSHIPERVRKDLIDLGLSEASVNRIVALSPADISLLHRTVLSATDRIAPSGRIGEKDLLHLDALAGDYARARELPDALVPALQELLLGIKNNLARDELATRAAQDHARDTVPSVRRSILEKEIIVRRGDPVSAEKIRLMSLLGMLQGPGAWRRAGGILILVFLVLFSLAAFAKAHAPAVYRDDKRVAIFFILVGLAVLGAFALTPYNGFLLGLCIAVLSILTCSLLDASLALLAVPLVSILCALTLDLRLTHVLTALACGLAAHYFAVRRHDRDAFVKAGIAVAAAGIVSTLTLSALEFSGFYRLLFDGLLVGFFNGFLAFVVASGLIPVLEKVFNITTPRRLLELSNPEEPLLKQLLIQAPGTYHHSLFVGNLAETAADLIGADTLLVRIASFYHDAGKLKRPYFFTENIMHGASHLNDVSPTLGALVIASHVKDGIEMAREHNLPPEVIHMIQEHHGTCLISFFYQQARAAARNGDDVSKERFRYTGPKPQSLESAVVMLADACEAATRSLKEPSPKAIESQVNSIFHARLIDGQFDECNITLKQIDTIRRCFIKSLAGIYHSRIEYPDLKDIEHVREP